MYKTQPDFQSCLILDQPDLANGTSKQHQYTGESGISSRQDRAKLSKQTSLAYEPESVKTGWSEDAQFFVDEIVVTELKRAEIL